MRQDQTVATTASDKIGRQMMQQKQAANDGSREYFFITVDTIHFCKFTSLLAIEQFILIGIFECFKIVECPTR
jgi:hypothetical protein